MSTNRHHIDTRVDIRAKEEKLVLAAMAGNERAFEALYRLYQPSLLRFSFRLCSDDTLARDAVQDAWMLTLRSMKQVFPPHTFRARVFRAVRWRTFDHIRRCRKNAGEELFEETIADDNPEAWATSDQLRRLIKALPAGEGEALYLFYLEDLSVAEIAAIQAVPSGTVKSRLARARGRLKQQVDPPADKPPDHNSEANINGPSHGPSDDPSDDPSENRVKLEIVK